MTRKFSFLIWNNKCYELVIIFIYHVADSIKNLILYFNYFFLYDEQYEYGKGF